MLTFILYFFGICFGIGVVLGILQRITSINFVSGGKSNYHRPNYHEMVDYSDEYFRQEERRKQAELERGIQYKMRRDGNAPQGAEGYTDIQ